MNRRHILRGLGALAGAAAAGQPVSATDDDGGLPELDLVERDHQWVSAQLERHYGSRWRSPPNSGIYHLWFDNRTHVARTREAALSRLRVFGELPQPEREVDKYDCEDFSLAVRSTMVRAYPRLCLGVVVSHSSEHTWNVVPTIEDSVVEFEPQTGEEVTDRDGKYSIDRGIVML